MQRCLWLGAVALAMSGIVRAADADSDPLHTRTIEPAPSVALTQALGLDVAPWHKPGVTMEHVKLPPDTARHSAEAALQALDALDPSVPQNDFDRVWIASERAAALRDAGRQDEARVAFEHVLGMSRTQEQDRRAMAALHDLGETQYPGFCAPGRLIVSGRAPLYPRALGRHRIEGWVKLWMDIEAGGKIAYAFVSSSSIRAFEAPILDALAGLRVKPQDATHPIETPCTARARIVFRSYVTPVFLVDNIKDDSGFTYRSIGAAIRVRVDAHNAVIQQRAATP